MIYNDMLFLTFCFVLLFASIVLNNTTSLQLLLTAELLWINLFSISLIAGIVFNNLNVLSLTFFFLVLSAIEFGIGLVLMLIQLTLTRSINIIDSAYNKNKFVNRIKTSLYITRFKWKI